MTLALLQKNIAYEWRCQSLADVYGPLASQPMELSAGSVTFGPSTASNPPSFIAANGGNVAIMSAATARVALPLIVRQALLMEADARCVNIWWRVRTAPTVNTTVFGREIGQVDNAYIDYRPGNSSFQFRCREGAPVQATRNIAPTGSTAASQLTDFFMLTLAVQSATSLKLLAGRRTGTPAASPASVGTATFTATSNGLDGSNNGTTTVNNLSEFFGSTDVVEIALVQVFRTPPGELDADNYYVDSTVDLLWNAGNGLRVSPTTVPVVTHAVTASGAYAATYTVTSNVRLLDLRASAGVGVSLVFGDFAEADAGGGAYTYTATVTLPRKRAYSFAVTRVTSYWQVPGSAAAFPAPVSITPLMTLPGWRGIKAGLTAPAASRGATAPTLVSHRTMAVLAPPEIDPQPTPHLGQRVVRVGGLTASIDAGAAELRITMTKGLETRQTFIDISAAAEAFTKPSAAWDLLGGTAQEEADAIYVPVNARCIAGPTEHDPVLFIVTGTRRVYDNNGGTGDGNRASEINWGNDQEMVLLASMTFEQMVAGQQPTWTKRWADREAVQVRRASVTNPPAAGEDLVGQVRNAIGQTWSANISTSVYRPGTYFISFVNYLGQLYNSESIGYQGQVGTSRAFTCPVRFDPATRAWVFGRFNEIPPFTYPRQNMPGYDTALRATITPRHLHNAAVYDLADGTLVCQAAPGDAGPSAILLCWTDRPWDQVLDQPGDEVGEGFSRPGDPSGNTWTAPFAGDGNWSALAFLSGGPDINRFLGMQPVAAQVRRRADGTGEVVWGADENPFSTAIPIFDPRLPRDRWPVFGVVSRYHAENKQVAFGSSQGGGGAGGGTGAMVLQQRWSAGDSTGSGGLPNNSAVERLLYSPGAGEPFAAVYNPGGDADGGTDTGARNEAPAIAGDVVFAPRTVGTLRYEMRPVGYRKMRPILAGPSATNLAAASVGAIVPGTGRTVIPRDAAWLAAMGLPACPMGGAIIYEVVEAGTVDRTQGEVPLASGINLPDRATVAVALLNIETGTANAINQQMRVQNVSWIGAGAPGDYNVNGGVTPRGTGNSVIPRLDRWEVFADDSTDALMGGSSARTNCAVRYAPRYATNGDRPHRFLAAFALLAGSGSQRPHYEQAPAPGVTRAAQVASIDGEDAAAWTVIAQMHLPQPAGGGWSTTLTLLTLTGGSDTLTVTADLAGRAFGLAGTVNGSPVSASITAVEGGQFGLTDESFVRVITSSNGSTTRVWVSIDNRAATLIGSAINAGMVLGEASVGASAVYLESLVATTTAATTAALAETLARAAGEATVLNVGIAEAAGPEALWAAWTPLEAGSVVELFVTAADAGEPAADAVAAARVPGEDGSAVVAADPGSRDLYARVTDAAGYTGPMQLLAAGVGVLPTVARLLVASAISVTMARVGSALDGYAVELAARTKGTPPPAADDAADATIADGSPSAALAGLDPELSTIYARAVSGGDKGPWEVVTTTAGVGEVTIGAARGIREEARR